jgi:hypothetical protein
MDDQQPAAVTSPDVTAALLPGDSGPFPKEARIAAGRVFAEILSEMYPGTHWRPVSSRPDPDPAGS